MRSRVLLHCWHESSFESAAMWALYAGSGYGLAIRTTCRRLKDSFSTFRDWNIYLGRVQYVDYSAEKFADANNRLSPFLYKRLSFAHEREVRALIWTLSPTGEEVRFPEGLAVPADLGMLIERVYVAPTVPSWIRALAERLVDRLGLSVEVKQSDLAADPVF